MGTIEKHQKPINSNQRSTTEGILMADAFRKQAWSEYSLKAGTMYVLE